MVARAAFEPATVLTSILDTDCRLEPLLPEAITELSPPLTEKPLSEVKSTWATATLAPGVAGVLPMATVVSAPRSWAVARPALPESCSWMSSPVLSVSFSSLVPSAAVWTLAAILVVPVCALTAWARADRSPPLTAAEIVTGCELASLAIELAPRSVNWTAPSVMPDKVAVVLALAVTPLCSLWLLTLAAICLALSPWLMTTGVVTPAPEVMLSVWAVTVLPLKAAAPVVALAGTAMAAAACEMVLVRPELSVLLPMSAALALWMPMLMVWLALAPTWNWVDVRLPSSTFWPLNWVLVATRSSSADREDTSFWIDWRSESELDPLADWT